MSDEIVNTIGWYTYKVIPKEHYVEVKFYEVFSKYEEGDLEWKSEDDEPTSDLSNAKCIGEGSVKWDECSNWNFLPNNILLHFCNIDQMIQFHAVVRSAYIIANKAMEENNE